MALGLKAALAVAGISTTRFHGWLTVDEACSPEGLDSCPKRQPNQLTADEVSAIREMVLSPDYRHVPTSRLAILAQRFSGGLAVIHLTSRS